LAQVDPGNTGKIIPITREYNEMKKTGKPRLKSVLGKFAERRKTRNRRNALFTVIVAGALDALSIHLYQIRK